jgi:hypothetical protein
MRLTLITPGWALQSHVNFYGYSSADIIDATIDTYIFNHSLIIIFFSMYCTTVLLASLPLWFYVFYSYINLIK